MIANIIDTLNNYLYSYILVIVLLGVGIIFTLKTKFIQFHWKEMSAAFSNSLTGNSKSKKISSFEAFAVTTASRVGTGNLAGVALAIIVGGPGAIFWMWITALLGGSLAFIESTLAQIFKVHDKDNTHFRGGPAYYMQQGLHSKTMGLIFSILLLMVFGIAFNSVQANTIALAFENSFHIPTIVSAFILSILSAAFIFGGLPRIAKASALIVPVMAILYLILCLIVIFINLDKIGNVFLVIFQNAFGLKEFGTGTLIGTIVTGVKRGLFSNEAGMGSAPNAAAAADTSHPVKQGLIQACGVFFDTIIICSATAFLILFSGVDISNASSGIALTQNALTIYFGNMGNIFLSVCIFLLAFSSILGNYFYAQNTMLLISHNKIVLFSFKILVIVPVFAGSVAQFNLVWNIADLFMGLMALLNIYAIVKLFPFVQETLLDYQAQSRQGKDPAFNKVHVKGLEDVECWD
ncbi:alanine or glycine:cation symporter, AGCS family [Brevinema andersonii]|uniref:Alanine or glycine:cation symporter, AGCS family n=1 Tax=Brevinema andersonii TaxID=34097 RepID=A0A1I1EZ32_BREAD|nr:alanine/glycine:cation symporter family protein [Brevinema andersonii]SFB92459.1 alanine or glycine:cation symporter, AGCS family [Brevinema andersonii]